jgi:glycopeptide antibiotics resistance protein
MISISINVYRKKHNKAINWNKEVYKFLFSIYIFILIGTVFFPLWIGRSLYENIDIKNFINLIPFKQIVKEVKSVGTRYDGDIAFHISLILRNLLGNIILLLPFGFMCNILWHKINTVKKVTILALLVSLSIEFIQLVMIILHINKRVVDIDDVILNTVGFIIGYYLYRLYSLIITRIKKNNKGGYSS